MYEVSFHALLTAGKSWKFVSLSVCAFVRVVRARVCDASNVVAGCSEVFSPTLDYRGRGNIPARALNMHYARDLDYRVMCT